MIGLPELAAALDGEVASMQVLAPGPGHSRKDRSLAVRPAPAAADGFLVFSHAGDDWRECRDYVRQRLGIEWRHPRTVSDPIENMRRAAARFEAERAHAAEIERKRQRAVAIWNAALDPRGTVVEDYLRSRCLELPSEIAGGVLRFHPACPWKAEDGELVRVPAMIAALRSIGTDEILGIHRTALTPDGQKIGRKMLGTAAGTAIKLDSGAGPTLTIGEGIETTLSARQLGFGLSWAVGSVGAIASLPILPGVRSLTLLEEVDAGASARAIEECGTRWHRAARVVTVVRPKVGSDLNDAIREVAA
jgi:putative DNA primase/helicase